MKVKPGRSGEFLPHENYLANGLQTAPENWPQKKTHVVLKINLVDGLAGPPQVVATYFGSNSDRAYSADVGHEITDNVAPTPIKPSTYVTFNPTVVRDTLSDDRGAYQQEM